jgi:hypothetical protein
MGQSITGSRKSSSFVSSAVNIRTSSVLNTVSFTCDEYAGNDSKYNANSRSDSFYDQTEDDEETN